MNHGSVPMASPLRDKALDVLIRPSVEVVSNRCVRERHKNSKCTRCRDICPENAIELGQGPVIDKYGCTGCGFCGSICPPGALVPINFPFAQLRSLLEAKKEIFFGCTLNDSEGNLMAPCSGSLTPGMLAASAKDHSATINHSKCAGCKYAKGAELTSRRVEVLNRILNALGEPNRIDVVSKSPRGITDSQMEEGGRRDFIKQVGAEGMGLIEQILPFKSSPAKEKLQLEKKIMPRKHALLVNLILDHEDPTAGLILDLPEIGLASMSVNDSCNGCGMCSTFCPTGALVMDALENDDGSGRATLVFDAKRCLRCDLCVDICPREAIAYNEHLTLSEIFGSGKELASFEMKRCSQCGQPFVYAITSSEFCLKCKKEDDVKRHLLGETADNEG